MGIRIPETRFGRAIKAGLPVALVIVGAEIVEDVRLVQGSGGRLTVSGSADEIAHFARIERTRRPELRLTSAESLEKGEQKLVIDVPEHYAITDILVTAREAIDAGLSFSYEEGHKHDPRMRLTPSG